LNFENITRIFTEQNIKFNEKSVKKTLRLKNYSFLFDYYTEDIEFCRIISRINIQLRNIYFKFKTFFNFTVETRFVRLKTERKIITTIEKQGIIFILFFKL
jgi:hypothetical protein